MIPRSSWGASATSPRAEGEELEVRNKDRTGAPRAKVSVVISRRASVIREFKRGMFAAGLFYHYRPFSHYPTFASFAVLFSLPCLRVLCGPLRLCPEYWVLFLPRPSP